MEIGKLYNRVERRLSDIAVCVLFALCLCLPAQQQIIKIPFLGLACVLGLIRLYQTRGRSIAKSTWIWFGAYWIYNLIWSILGIVNGYSGANNYFRLGVVWPVAFFFVTSCMGKNTIKWIVRVMFLVVAVQVVSVFLLIGYAFQLWPNILQTIYRDAAVGIHPGYIHVVSHFVGGMAFSVPFVYSYVVLNHKTKRIWQILFVPVWFLVITALVATSRRILLVVIVVCAAAVMVIPLLCKKDRKMLLIRSAVGLALTCVFIVTATSMITNVTIRFLSSNYDAVLKVIQERPEEQTTIKYTHGLVFNLEGIVPPQDEEPTTEPTEPEDSEGATRPTKPKPKPTEPHNNQVGDEGFKDRFNGLVGEMGSGFVRGDILSGALEGWKTSPIIGVGFGAPLPGYEGAGDGIYEMEYVVRLYTTGIVGIAILLVLMLFVGIAPLKHIRLSGRGMTDTAPCTVAYLGAVVATLSNPYIFSGFDYLFMLFLPIAFLNSINTEKTINEGKER